MANRDLENLRRALEPTGDILRIGQLPSKQVSIKYEDTGEISKGKVPEFEPNRTRFPDIFDGNQVDADEYDQTRSVFDKATGRLEEQLIQRPINLLDLNLPTATTDVSRPRTLAAGYYLYVGERAKPYDDRKGTVTVMFRDGTLYNYYNVPPGVWSQFKSAASKGPMLNRANRFQGSDGVLLNYPHGPADISEVPQELQQYIYRVARSEGIRQQKISRSRKIRLEGTRGIAVTGRDRFGKRREAGKNYGYVSTSSQKSLKSRIKAASGGTNPAAKRGRNPNQK